MAAAIHPIDDLVEFDAFLKARCVDARTRLLDMLGDARLTLADARVHRVLIPMTGVYTPGFQALPACSWEFVELVTDQGPVGSGEWSITLPSDTRAALAALRGEPDTNLLDQSLERPLFMAWWDLVGQVLGKPLHQLLAEIFEVGFEPPTDVPLAAYSWNRFPDRDGNHEVTFETWPAFARSLADEGFKAVKVSMTAYEPEDYVELLERIRDTLPEHVELRIDAHGTWNFREARAILPRLEPLGISYVETPFNALLPASHYADGRHRPATAFQREYYFRKLEELRHHTTLPFSDHWWTPPIIQPDDAHRMDNLWEPDWELISRYDPVDIAVPDIGLGVFGLYRLLALARFMGLGVTLHSNFELGIQSSFRAALFSALGYYPERAGIYLGSSPRQCEAMDTEYNQVSDDVLADGKLAFVDGHLRLSGLPGHGRVLDPDRLAAYRWTEERARPHREHAERLYASYRLDRPRRRTPAGWPKLEASEQFDRHTYPYDVTGALALARDQDVDMELNR